MSSASYALAELKEFNKFVIENPRLRDYFVLNDYDFLHVYQALIFFDFKGFYEKNKVNTFPIAKEGVNLNFPVAAKIIFAFLVSLLSSVFLIVSRRRVLIYSADKMNSIYKGDFRIDGLYKCLFENNVRFFEILHTTFGPDFYSDFFKRRRPVIYLESLDIFYKIALKLKKLPDYNKIIGTINAGAFDNNQFFRSLLTKYIRLINKSKLRIKILKRILSLTAARIMIGSFSTRYTFELIEAGNLARIKTFFFQAGALSKYDIGFTDNKTLKGKIIKPTKFFVETDYWKKELLRLGTYFSENEIEIGGSLKQDLTLEEAPSFQNKNREGISILIPYEIFAPKNEILEYIKKFLNCSGVKVIFKLRADRNSEEQLAEYGLNGISRNFVFTTKAESNFDIAAGTYSTLLYEMIGKGKPVVVLKTSLDHGEGMVINGLADSLDINEPDFCGRLNQVKNLSADVLTERRRRLYEGAVPLTLTLQKILKL